MSTSFCDRLIGVWELLSYVAYAPDNPSEAIFPLGSRATGIVFYHPHGYMSGHLQDPTQSPNANADIHTAAGYIGYAGRFWVENITQRGAETMVVKHQLLNASRSEWIDSVQERRVRFETGDVGEEVIGAGYGGAGFSAWKRWKREGCADSVEKVGEERVNCGIGDETCVGGLKLRACSSLVWNRSPTSLSEDLPMTASTSYGTTIVSELRSIIGPASAGRQVYIV